YVRVRRLERTGRGILRLVHFPPGDNEDLVTLWLWSEQKGVFSHETALMLHQLADALPAKRHMSVPRAWARRRLRVPRGVVLHFERVPRKAFAWLGPVPLTRPLRTILDCTRAGAPNDLLRQAALQGISRGLFDRANVRRVLRIHESKRRKQKRSGSRRG